MANVGTQTTVGLQVDLDAFTRALKRAKRNTTRSRARNAEVTRMLERLVFLYTEETTSSTSHAHERRAVGQ